MDVRFTVSLIAIAVGALMALMGGMSVVMTSADTGFRLGCGGVGIVGVLFVVFGLRLRNKAVAESPALQRALRDEGETSRTEAAKPGFLKKPPATGGEPAASSPPAQKKPAPPAKPPRVSLLYWLILAAFVVVVVGLTLGTMDFFQGKMQVRLVATVIAVLGVLLFPLVWTRRRSGRGGWFGTYDGSASSDDWSDGGGDYGGDGGGGGGD